MKKIELTEVLNIICVYFKTNKENIFSENRSTEKSYHRQMFHFISYEKTGETLTKIGQFCKRHHGTILYSYNKMRFDINNYSKIKRDYCNIMEIIDKKIIESFENDFIVYGQAKIDFLQWYFSKDFLKNNITSKLYILSEFFEQKGIKIKSRSNYKESIYYCEIYINKKVFYGKIYNNIEASIISGIKLATKKYNRNFLKK